MIDDLLTKLRYKSEGTDLDFKSKQYRFIGGSEESKAEMLKDILAIANAWRDGAGYILLGFKDQRPHPAEVVGISESIDDAQIQQLVNSKVSPHLTFSYEEHLYEGKTIGIISIPKQKRTFYLKNSYGKLKSNVVYVRRGSSTDEATPPEIAAMMQADAGSGDIHVELRVSTPTGDNLPDSIARSYLQFTEKFPDYASPREPRDLFGVMPDAYMWVDNKNFWREYAEYIRVHSAAIELKFALANQSKVSLSNAKLEAYVEALDGQKTLMLAGTDMPIRPQMRRSSLHTAGSLSNLINVRDSKLVVESSGHTSVCHVRFGTLLPGEEGRVAETLAVIPLGPGRVRMRLRILAAELEEPHEIERVFNATGDVVRLDFESFEKATRKKGAASESPA